MCCKSRRFIAKVANTMLLTMGGFSFGRDLSLYLFGRDVHDMLIVGLIGASLFFVFSLWMRQMCKCPIHDRK